MNDNDNNCHSYYNIRHRIWPGESSTVQWKWSPPFPGSLKALLFPPLLNKVENKGTQGVWARYDAELPPIISIVRHPGRPVILGVERSLLSLLFQVRADLGKGMRTATFQFSESGGSVNGPNLFTELPFLYNSLPNPHSLNCLPPFHWKTLFLTGADARAFIFGIVHYISRILGLPVAWHQRLFSRPLTGLTSKISKPGRNFWETPKDPVVLKTLSQYRNRNVLVPQ